METIINNPNKHNGRTIAGIIIVILGGLLLIDQLNLFFIPDWLFSWPMFLIGYGLYVGGKYNFHKPIWIWMTVLGLAFLITENFDDADRLVWPVAIIGIGTWMVLKHKRPAIPMQDTTYKEV